MVDSNDTLFIFVVIFHSEEFTSLISPFHRAKIESKFKITLMR